MKKKRPNNDVRDKLVDTPPMPEPLPVDAGSLRWKS